MPFLSAEFRGAKIVRKGLENLRARTPLISRKRIYDFMRDLKKDMSVVGEPSTSPVNWDSMKQMRAYFATDGFGAGIPYSRTDETRKSFEIIKTEDGYDFGNPQAHSIYLYGTLRSTASISNIHKGRYPELKTVYELKVKKLPKTVRESLVSISRQSGFRSE